MLNLKSLKYLVLVILLITAISVAIAEEMKNEVVSEISIKMQKKISVDFRNTLIEDVLRIMAAQADVDIVKSPNVIGTVTATLTDVPLEEALNNILMAHGYGYVKGKNMLRVVPLAEITTASERLESKVYRIIYADVLEVEKSLKKFISKRGSVSSNPGTSNIIVTDIESKIKAIEEFLEEIDRETPQILIEVRIYDITSKDQLDLGVEWVAGRRTTYTNGVPDAGTLTTPFMTGGFAGSTTKATGTSGLLRIGWLNEAIDFNVLLKAQETIIDAKLLANPRVLVLDNEKAMFRIISEIPYQEITESTSGGSVASTEFKDVGVKLEVIPHLCRAKELKDKDGNTIMSSDEDLIRIQIRPEFSVKVGEVVQAGGNYPIPIIDKREAVTTLLVQNGKTVVLGGLRKKEVTKQVNKVPLLGDIPLLGNAFKFKGEDTIVSEMVVFITPRVIKTPRLSKLEQEQYAETEFAGPDPKKTFAEKDMEKK